MPLPLISYGAIYIYSLLLLTAQRILIPPETRIQADRRTAVEEGRKCITVKAHSIGN